MRALVKLVMAMALACLSAPVLAQSVPNGGPSGISLTPGATVWTPQQWIGAWQSKQDVNGDVSGSSVTFSGQTNTLSGWLSTFISNGVGTSTGNHIAIFADATGRNIIDSGISISAVGGLVPPSASLLGGNGASFTSIAIGSGLSLNAGTLTATVAAPPSAAILGGTGSGFSSISVGSGLSLINGVLSGLVSPPSAALLGGTGTAFNPISLGTGLSLNGSVLSATAASPPSASLLGGTGSGFTSVSVGGSLIFTGGVLSGAGPPPTAALLGGTSSGFTSVSVGAGLTLSTGVLTSNVVPPAASLLGGTGTAFTPITLGSGLALNAGVLTAGVCTQGCAFAGNTTMTQITEATTNQFFLSNGSNIQRFNDRVFIGGATANNGNQSAATTDWTGTVYSGAFAYIENNGTLNVSSNGGHLGIVGATRTSDGPGGTTSPTGNASIAVNSIVVNDNTSGTGVDGWNYYGTAVKGPGATGLSTVGMEQDVANLGSLVQLFPFGQGLFENGLTADMWLAACNELCGQTGKGYTFNLTSAGIVFISNNPAGYANVGFDKGILFGDGSVPSQVAIAFPTQYEMEWFNSSNARVAAIYSSATVASPGQQINITNNGTLFEDLTGGRVTFEVAAIPNVANWLVASGGATGTAAILSANGSDTNISIQLLPKGAGTVLFGTSAGVSCTGAPDGGFRTALGLVIAC